ncbi:YbaK/EbsC family protein [Proteiniclasticum ruminis]|uniref:Anticodon binding domain-containing protein n=1 Tax=Proteiniclasticum ruminis TaxID=398199 RepID=A0A1I5EP71_9CLOT|nr:YbaK/EbsC family protein [Proteiniclasticum ruminis]SFO13305.1 Anticodon binding domain-containing protein [Proteiniclasticum ruminis]
MDFEQMNIRTKKEDSTKDGKDLAYLMERAGMQFRVKDVLYKTPFGLMEESVFQEKIESVLRRQGFSEYYSSGTGDLKGLMGAAHQYASDRVTSYKDLPYRMMTKENAQLQDGHYVSIWKNRHQRVLLASVLGEEKTECLQRGKEVLSLLEIPFRVEGDMFYYEHEEAPRVSVSPESLEKEYGPRAHIEEIQRRTVETPGIKTVEDLVQFFQCQMTDVLKTMLLTDGDKVYAVLTEGNKEVDLKKVGHVLSLKEDSLKPLSKERILEQTGAEAGFAGPVGLKADKILIDHSVKKEKAYITGANRTDHHIQGVYYGRDFSGYFYHLTESEESFKGWLLGSVKVHDEKIRVQSKEGGYSYEPLTSLYLNLDRMNYALLEESKDEKGFDLSKAQAPFSLVITLIDPRIDKPREKAEEMYEELKLWGLRVLKDFRKDRLGSKFSDYDLLGIPYRILVAKDGTFDVKDRNGNILEKGLQNLVEIRNNEVIE